MKLVTLEFKLSGDLSTLPFRLTGIAMQKVECCLIWLKGVMLSEVAKPESWMPDNLTSIEFFFSENDTKEGTFAGTVSADETRLSLICDGGRGLIEQDLIAVPFRCIPNFKQNRHATPTTKQETESRPEKTVSATEGWEARERRAWDSNPQPLAGHHNSNVAASHSRTLRNSLFRLLPVPLPVPSTF